VYAITNQSGFGIATECFTVHRARTFRSIQGLTTLISRQAFEIDSLIATYMEEVGAIGPLLNAMLWQLDRRNTAISGRLLFTWTKYTSFLPVSLR
jgi:hypothetical protein